MNSAGRKAQKLFMKGLFVALLAFVVMPPTVVAQLGTGSLAGTVKDPSGALIRSAVVAARNMETGVETSAVTNESGNYLFPALGVGVYSVTVDVTGFRKEVNENVRILTGVAVNLDISLTVGSNAQEVTVNAAQPVADTTTSTTGITQTLDEVADLPVELNNRQRNPTDLLQTFPGVIYLPSTNNNTSVINGVGDGGGYNSFTSYRIDGIDGSVQPTQSFSDSGALEPDVVQEIRVVTNTNTESFGDMGSAIDMVTKSGTNQYHGDLYEYARNDAFDARNYFATSVSPYKQHDFAGVLGGPIVKDKDFFLVSLGGYFLRTAPAGVIATVPTAKMRTGDFSELLGTGQGTIYDPATTTETPQGFVRQPFPGNIIPSSRISPVSNYFLQGYPLPNRPGLQNNWQGVAVPDNLNKMNLYVKTDHVITPRQHLSAGVEFVPYWSSDGCVSIYAQALAGWGPQTLGCSEQTEHSFRIRLNYTYLLKDNMLLSARVGYNSDSHGSIVSNPGRTNEGQQAGLSGFYEPGLPQVTMDNTQGFGITQRASNGGWGAVIPMYLDLSILKGNHQIKFGFQPEIIFFPSNAEYEAGIDFSDLSTGQPGLPNTGWGFASFLLGNVYSVNDTSPIHINYHMGTWGLFIQDQWRATPKLTLSYGLRYDQFLSPYEKSRQTAFFDPTIPNPGADGYLGAISFWGQGTGRNGRKRILNTDMLVFSPRIGVAYAWTPRLVSRIYWGIDRNPLQYIYYGGTGAPPYGFTALVSATSLDSGITPVFNWNNPFPFPLPTLPDLNPALENGQGVAYTDPSKDQAALGQNFGVANQFALGKGLVLDVNYVGKVETGLPTAYMVGLNQLDPKYYSLGPLLLDPITSSAAQQAGIPLPYASFTGSVAQALRPYPQYSDIDYVDTKTRKMVYNAASFSVQKHFGAGFNFLLNYTISKDLSNDQGPGCVHYLCVGPPSAEQVTGQRAWGPISVDEPQVFSGSYTYELPFGLNKRFLGNASQITRVFVEGWLVSGIQSYASGTPVLVSTGSSIPTVGAVWANRVPGVQEKLTSCGNYKPGGGSTYLNPAAFVAPPPYTLGTVNYVPNVRGCPTVNEDLSAAKSFAIRESINLKIGGELFNAFNRHEWSSLAANVNNPGTFGTFSAATNPRTIQLYGRITF